MKSYTKKALESLPAKTPEAYRKLVQELGKKVPQEDKPHFSADLFGEMAHSHWELAKEKSKNGPKISIYCPLVKGHRHRKTVIDIVSEDMAFLVDSVAAEINTNNFLIDLLIHPIVYVKYDKAGKLADISSKAQKGYTRQSHIHVHIKETLSEKDLVELEEGLYTAMADVFTANRDWKIMLTKLKEARDELARAKTKQTQRDLKRYCAFLDYLYDNNFTLLGYREYEFIEQKDGVKSKTLKGCSLGLLSDDVRPAYISENKEGLPRNLQELRRSLPPVSVSKTNRLSTVHRQVPMDAIAIKTYDENGNVRGEKLFIGLFTSVTYSRSVSDVPFLREKVEDVMSMSDFLPGSHNSKALRHILEKYPRDELFQIPNDELFKICLNILRLQERQRIALFMRQDAFGRYISCLVYVPRDRFGTVLRKKIGTILEKELNGVCTSFRTTMDDSVFARVMFTINVSQKSKLEFDAKALEKKLQDAGQTWSERLTIALSENLDDEADVTRLTLKFSDAFPVNYTTNYSGKQAVFDIQKIERAIEDDKLALDLYRTNALEDNQLRLKVYNPGAPLNLSDVMPILDNMGLRAISELPFKIMPNGAEKPVWIHDFLLETKTSSQAIDIEEVKENFETAFTKIWYFEMESDALNKLILRANMNWLEIRILRLYTKYLRQIRYPFSPSYIQSAITENPKTSGVIIKLFEAYNDPKRISGFKKDVPEISKSFEKEMQKVESLDQDRTLRMIKSLVDATLRTNHYQRDENGEPKIYLSVKLDSRKVPGIPKPAPFREIFVYSPRVEAIHLRGDKIARGGLRWSDRAEDFRTEVLGLMKAQQVKNAVIVPMGSKGGFVVKKQTKDRKEFIAEGIECYKIFIRGLLDITDNLKNNKVVPPKDVVRHDGDDPYLVVAADKGTATFSDIANAVSQEYGFWMDDAFASGGSAGYDHKKMGITAKGAWESIKLHFRQLNHNTQTQPFDVIGVGDMGGDVFGNGMLLSKQIQLVGAFNHLHIFCDPNPDAAESFKERQRLFKGVMGWDQYDTKKLSKGGRIFERSEKSLKLTPEIMKRFDIDKDKVSPRELIHAMLQARTDLLFFGGIGTYIKSEDETHGDVGDKANDALRINGKQVRAKVIGEGANLAVTQLGRIEFAEKGGKINTDFLDNSAGVDSSDHEVNIKILLTAVMRRKDNDMDLKARNKLLESMTEEVGHKVLWNNYQQAQAISLAEIQAKENLKIHDEFIQDLEREKGIDRTIEGLPNADEIKERLRLGKGLTRPELCVLLAYAKISFMEDLLKCDVPDDPEMQDWLVDYFPKPLQKDFTSEIKNHRLHREIVATKMSNSLINRMGPTFIKSLMKKTGAPCPHIARAYLIVREAYSLRPLWDSIEALDNKVPAEVQLKAMREVAQVAEYAITWFLTRLGRDLDMGKDIESFGAGIDALRKNVASFATNDLKNMIKQRTDNGVRDGLPESVAKQIAMMPVLASACDIIKISIAQKTDLKVTAATYFEIGQKFHLDWLRKQARFITSEDYWQSEATSGVIEQLYSCQAGLTARILCDMEKSKTKNGDLAEKWLSQHVHIIDQIDPLFAKLKDVGTVDLAMLIIAEQRLRSLYGG